MDSDKEMKDGLEGMEKEEEQKTGGSSGEPEAVVEDIGGENPTELLASVDVGATGDAEEMTFTSKDEELVSANGHRDANASETDGGHENDGDGANENAEKQPEDEAVSDGSPDMREEENGTESKEVIPEKEELKTGYNVGNRVEQNNITDTTAWETQYEDGEESGTEEEQRTFRREVESFYKERNFEFKGPKFYKEDVNLLKLYREVIKLGGYELVTSCKLWRNVGAPFRPPKTCTTVSWTFRNFYEKSLIEYEKHRMRCGKLPFNDDSYREPKVDNQVGVIQPSGTGRTMRDAAARAMHVWSPRVVDDDDGKPAVTAKGDKNQKGFPKRKKPSSTNFDHASQGPRMKSTKSQTNATILDVGPPADWVKVNVYKISNFYEVYCLIPGLLREEVHVQSDPVGRLIISGQPEQLDNPWGVTPFKKVVSLPTRIDPQQTAAVVTLNGQLFVRVPVEQADS